jgi:radical SAM protein with 4Fe4S-binding SPASM domain
VNPDCSILDGKSWAAGFRGRAARDRVPVTATLELTSRCNLRCRHCYLGSQTDQHARREEERTTEEVKASLREWADAGCLYLLITGGDPMIRPDFAEIYRTAAELGMLVSVFCDGILVTDEIADLFRELPPRKVEISIYGATAQTYEAVTRVPGSHRLAWAGIRRLLDAGVRLTLKTMVLTLNVHEFEAMAARAAELGCEFRSDATVFPCLSDGSTDPLSLRLGPEEIVRWDTQTAERCEKWLENIEKIRDLPESDRVYACGAGRTLFHCDPYGNLSPCLMTRNYRYSAEGRTFAEVWSRSLGAIQKKVRTKPADCQGGELRGACTGCPAVNYAETGDEEVASEHMRKTTRLRYEAIMAFKDKKELS